MATAEDIKIRLTADNQASKNIQKVKGDIQDLGMSSKQAAATLAASNGKITKNFSTLGRSAGMAGMQVQQFVGQVQMGTNPLMALSQQGADLGFVLGVPLLGAIVGIGSSIAMTLIPSLNEAEVKLSDMRDSLKGLTGDFKNMSDEMRAASVAILVGELTEQTLEYNKAVKAREEAEKKVVEAQKDLAESKAYATIKDASDTLAKYNTELNILVAQEAIANGVRQETQATLDRVVGATSNLTKEQEAQNEAHAEYIQQLEEEMLTFGMNADQKARYKMLGMPEEYRKTAEAIHEKIMAQKEEKRQFEENEKVREEIQKSSIEGFNKLAAHNKTVFKAQKAYNIANAVMDAYAGANKALAYYPPPISYAMAAGQIALGMANVATIKSQSFSGRAVGGRVEAGSPYMVGEQGREMFIPSTRGQIVKNSDVEAMGGSSGTTNINFSITTVDAKGFDELLTSRRGQIVNMVNQAMNDRGRTGVV